MKHKICSITLVINLSEEHIKMKHDPPCLGQHVEQHRVLTAPAPVLCSTQILSTMVWHHRGEKKSNLKHSNACKMKITNDCRNSLNMYFKS